MIQSYFPALGFHAHTRLQLYRTLHLHSDIPMIHPRVYHTPPKLRDQSAHSSQDEPLVQTSTEIRSSAAPVRFIHIPSCALLARRMSRTTDSIPVQREVIGAGFRATGSATWWVQYSTVLPRERMCSSRRTSFPTCMPCDCERRKSNRMKQ
jgi:hypothetical protein